MIAILLLVVSIFSCTDTVARTPKKHQQRKLSEQQQEPVLTQEKTDEQLCDTLAPPKKPVRPRTATDSETDKVDVNFEKIDLTNLLSWVEDVYNVKFLSDDAINPTPKDGKNVGGNQISFKTQQPLTKKQAWDLFITFLDMFDLTLVLLSADPDKPEFYRVVQQLQANRAPVPSFMNVDWQKLPDNDLKIRYIYFIQNSTLTNLQPLVESLRSTSATLQPFQELNAFVLTDKSSNIRSLMQIISELDTVSMPEAMSVFKLKHANAEDVVQLYTELSKSEDKGIAARILGPKKPQTSSYFPEMKLIAESRTNSLIILGTKEGIERIENFVVTHVDTELSQPYSPLYVYELQYANAEDIANILTEVTKFAQGSPAAQYGGVRDKDKYMRPMTFIPEVSGNKVLIKAEKDDYIKIKDIIQQLDVKQPQVAIEVLIVDVTDNDTRELGVQIRNKRDNTVGKNVDFQNSGITGSTNSGIVVKDTPPELGGLMGNLVKLAVGQPAGSTLLSIGTELTGGVWALFKVLQTRVHANVVSAPYLTTANKYTASVSLGETRRVISGVVAAAAARENTFDDVEANVTVKVTPQISSDGVINLQIYITVNDFTSAPVVGASGDTNLSAANRTTRVITTNASLGNREILAIGGLVRGEDREMVTKVPVLGDIPLLGWVFKNKRKERIKNNLLVFISPRLIEPRLEGGVNTFSSRKVSYSKTVLRDGCSPSEQRDPIHRWFFKDKIDEGADYLDNFIDGKNPKVARRDYREPCLERCDDCPVPPANRKKVCNGYDYREPCLEHCNQCDEQAPNAKLCMQEQPVADSDSASLPLAAQEQHPVETVSEPVVVAQTEQPQAASSDATQAQESSDDATMLARLEELHTTQLQHKKEQRSKIIANNNAILQDRSKKTKKSITNFLPQQQREATA